MGLDVYAVTKYEVIEDPRVSEEGDFCKIYQPSDFNSHLGENLEDGMYIDVINCGDGDYHSSYWRHSHFREFLASLAYQPVFVDKPDYSDDDYKNKSYQHRFPHIHGMYQIDGLSYENDFVALIHFSDCEGVICNEFCKVLDLAFEKHKNKVNGSDFELSYKNMAKCVKEAAVSGGYLYFH